MFDKLKHTAMLHAFGISKIPMLFYARPSVIELNQNRSVIKIRLRRRTKNHAGSMYFPVLAIGADCAIGLPAVHSIKQSGQDINFIFRNFHADFYRRATGDVLFTCDQAEEINELVAKAANNEERVEQTFEAIATVPSESDDPIALFTLTLSLKRKSK